MFQQYATRTHHEEMEHRGGEKEKDENMERRSEERMVNVRDGELHRVRMLLNHGLHNVFVELMDFELNTHQLL